MLRKTLFFISILLIGNAFASAQPKKPLRAFLPVDTRSDQVRVINDESSVYVIKGAISTTDLQVIRFDTLLQEVWGVGLQRSLPNLELVKIDEHRLFILMTSASEKELDVLELEEETGNYFLSRFTFSRPFQLKDFEAYRDHMWCSGWINEEGVAFALDSKTGGVKTLPIGYRQSISEVSNLRFDRQRKMLDLTLRTIDNKQAIFVHRSLSLEGRIIDNWVCKSPGGYNLKDFRITYPTATHPFAVGAIYKGNNEQLQGITTWRLTSEGEWSAKDHLWKSIPGFDERLLIETEEPAIRTKKGKWTNGMTALSEPMLGQMGMVFSIDQFQKQYNVRGALQRQFDQQQLVNQLDQDQFGRRGFDANETTIADRVDDFSNTDFSNYQFRELVVGNVDESGIDYVRSFVFSYDPEEGLSVQSIEKPPKAYGRMADGSTPLLNLEGRPIYLSIGGGHVHLVDLAANPPTLATVSVPMGPFTNQWGFGRLLNFGFLALDQEIYLFLQRHDFGRWIGGSPESSGH
ncbi:MAG: hypothetical protein AAGA85_10940 [Bacteroidota bacterium]